MYNTVQCTYIHEQTRQDGYQVGTGRVCAGQPRAK